MKRLFLSFALITLFLGGCASTGGSNVTGGSKGAYFEVYQDNRIYVFYDSKTYKEFLTLGETAFRITRIGAGPGGRTLVFGLAEADRLKTSGLASIDIWDGKSKPSSPFYGEVRTEDDSVYLVSDYASVVALRDGKSLSTAKENASLSSDGNTVFVAADATNEARLVAKYQSIHPQ